MSPEENPYIEKFSMLWPALVDLLKEMGVPFVMSVQFSPDDEGRPHAYHLVPGMNPRIVFGAVIAREGADGLQRLFPGMGPLEKMPEPEGSKKIAELEQGDGGMVGLEMPTFVDTMREIETSNKEEHGGVD